MTGSGPDPDEPLEWDRVPRRSRIATAARSSCEQRLRRLLAGRGRQRERLEERDGARPASVGPSTRAADATAALRTDEHGERRQQLGPVERLHPRRRRLFAEPEVDDHRPVRSDEHVRGPQRAVRHAARCKALRPARQVASRSVVVDLVGGERRRAGGRRRARARAPSSRPASAAIASTPGHATPALTREQQEERLVLDVVLQRRRRPDRRSDPAGGASGSRGREGRRRGCRVRRP